MFSPNIYPKEDLFYTDNIRACLTNFMIVVYFIPDHPGLSKIKSDKLHDGKARSAIPSTFLFSQEISVIKCKLSPQRVVDF